ncbi:hypothetical protein YB2330_005925 [Saitoella coloradoensis]
MTFWKRKKAVGESGSNTGSLLDEPLSPSPNLPPPVSHKSPPPSTSSRPSSSHPGSGSPTSASASSPRPSISSQIFERNVIEDVPSLNVAAALPHQQIEDHVPAVLDASAEMLMGGTGGGSDPSGGRGSGEGRGLDVEEVEIVAMAPPSAMENPWSSESLSFSASGPGSGSASPTFRALSPVSNDSRLRAGSIGGLADSGVVESEMFDPDPHNKRLSFVSYADIIDAEGGAVGSLPLSSNSSLGAHVSPVLSPVSESDELATEKASMGGGGGIVTFSMGDALRAVGTGNPVPVHMEENPWAA